MLGTLLRGANKVALSRVVREGIAARRVRNILRTYVVANQRTLEQKISDAGPSDQRIDPHILTQVRNDLVRAGIVKEELRRKTPWYYLDGTEHLLVAARLAELEPLYQKTQSPQFLKRLGQVLEIAIYRALAASTNHFVGSFADLEEHDDSSLYKKNDPPTTISGRAITKGGPLDFVVFQDAGLAGLEAKNSRQWMYPDRDDVR